MSVERHLVVAKGSRLSVIRVSVPVRQKTACTVTQISLAFCCPEASQGIRCCSLQCALQVETAVLLGWSRMPTNDVGSWQLILLVVTSC